MAERDPFEVLRENNPADPDDVDAYSAAASRTLNAISRRSSRRTRRLVLVAVALLAVIAAAAMVWVLTVRDVSALSLSCYEEISLASTRVGVEVDTFPSAADCELPWKNGTLQQPGLEPGEAPFLTACVTDDGNLAVFPSGDPTTCSVVGLATPTTDQLQAPLANLAEAQEAIRVYFFGGDCRLLDEAEREVRIILNRYGLDQWTIQRQQNQPDSPCASVSYDIPGTSVILSPIPLPLGS